MFRVGDMVVYGGHGVCRIVSEEKLSVDRKRMNFFILQPISQPNDRYYVPSENEAVLSKLKPLLSQSELDELLRSGKILKYDWIDDENKRKQMYRELIHSGDRYSLLGMVHSLYVHKRDLADTGRKMHLCDENFLRDAQKLLDSEFALVLGIDPVDVGSYVVSKLGADA